MLTANAKHLLHVRQPAKCFMFIMPLNPHTTQRSRHCSNFHLADEETKVQQKAMIRPTLHGQEVAGPCFEPGHCDFRAMYSPMLLKNAEGLCERWTEIQENTSHEYEERMEIQ